MSAEGPWTILKVLDWTREAFEKRGIDNPRLDAEVLMAHALHIPRVMLYARYDQPLAEAELAAIRAAVQRRSKREPVAQIIGEREFWSLDFIVTPGVLIPRPDTETTVEVALERIKAMGDRALSIADVGTGSGCIAVALAKELPRARLVALDRSDDARAVAKRNIERHGLAERIRLFSSDLLSGLPADAAPLDLIVANLPYIPSAELAGLMPEVRDFEPRLALDGGDDGLVLIRRLILEAPKHLRAGGAMVLETGSAETVAVARLLTESGFTEARVHKDFGALDRVASALRGGD